jgi:uncharacterized protein (TIGR00645 family)
MRSPLRPLPGLIFASRWLQLPLYLGLIAAQAVYVFHFWVELTHLLEAAFGSQAALQQLITSIGYKQTVAITTLNETVIMLVVLALIDVVMISNLLIMVIVGGYETFVSRMNLEGHPDQPEWLSHVNASVLKVKLAMAIIGISSIHLLKSFIEVGAVEGLPFCSRELLEAAAAEVVIGAKKTCTTLTTAGVMWQTFIHCVFIASAIGIAWTDRLMANGSHRERPGAAH